MEQIGYYAFICAMMLNYLVNHRNKIAVLFFNLATLLLAYNYIHMIGMYDIYDKTKYELFVISALFILMSLDKNIFIQIVNQKHMRLIFSLLMVMIISDTINGKINVINYIVYMQYVLIINGISNWKSSFEEMRIYIVRFALFFFTVMLAIYVVKFFQNPIFEFRINRISAIFPTTNEDAGFFLIFSIVAILSFNIRWVQVLVLLSVIFVLIFVLGTKTSIMAFLILCLLYLCRKKNYLLAPVFVLAVIVFGEYLFVFILQDFVPLVSAREVIFNRMFLADNTLVGRLTTVWIPAIDYTFREAPVFGFGIKGWIEVSTYSGMTGGFVFGDVYHRAAHNTFVFFFAELGLLGLFCVLILYYQITVKLKNSAKYRSDNQTFYLSMYLAWIAFFITSMTANVSGVSGWIVISIMFGIVNHPYSLKGEVNTCENINSKCN